MDVAINDPRIEPLLDDPEFNKVYRELLGEQQTLRWIALMEDLGYITTDEEDHGSQTEQDAEGEGWPADQDQRPADS
jgi:hypothetical protein